MERLSLKKVVLIFSMLSSMSLVDARAQVSDSAQQELPVVDAETYDRVVDIVFQSDAVRGVFGYAFLLQYRPTFGIESQITIRNEAGTIEVIEYLPLDGSIYVQLNKILQRTGRQDPVEMAKLIRIKRRTVRVRRLTVKHWRENFYTHVSRAMLYEKRIINENMKIAPLLVDDATSYYLSYRGAERIHFDLIGSAPDRPVLSAENPLIGWAKDIRKAILSLPSVSSLPNK